MNDPHNVANLSINTCDCTMGCVEPADPSAPEPTMCALCNGEDCVPRSSFRITESVEDVAAQHEAKYGPYPKPDDGLGPDPVDYGPGGTVVGDEGDYYMLVIHNVEADDTLWQRLCRRFGRTKVTTCYLSSMEPWTAEKLATNLMLAQSMGVGLDHVDVYTKLDLPKYIKPGILPGDPDEEY